MAGDPAPRPTGPDGNQAGVPHTIGLPLAGLPSGTRDGRLRGAITTILATARQHRAGAVVIENLDFTAARQLGRERAGNRPARGRRGRAFRHQVAGIPTARFRDRLTSMAATAGMAVIAVDPVLKYGATNNRDDKHQKSHRSGGTRSVNRASPAASAGLLMS